ncbi:F-box protein-like [Zostera marina]|uniref:F-box protein-like n=1 Tax=Zostera marina TaxID=29655 RepID=A0A0K9NJT3_ZOSMR|nr:F-box protein-like [Zostera marina]
MSESASGNKIVEVEESKGWEEMIPDALELIFKSLSLQEILTVIPGVCKSWKKAVTGPYCWQEINIDEWSQRNPQYIDQMIHMLITRSSGFLHKLCVSNLPNDHIFSFIADHAASLHTLELQRSEISNNIVEQVAGKFSNLTFLDISYCGKIGSSGIEAFGKNCRSLFVLKRVMDPFADKVCQDDEAHAIARSMPKLKTLELAYLRLTTDGVLDILTSCKNLEYLDVSGCWEVKLDKKLVKEELPGLKLVGPLIYWELWDNCSDYSESSGYLSWEFMDDGGVGYEVMSDDEGLWDEFMSDDEGLWDDDEDDEEEEEEQGLEQLEVRFYDGGFGNDVFVWPPSP